MKNDYSYIAVLTFDPDGVSIEFPDLPGCLSCAETYEEAYKNAKEALALHLYGMEQSNEAIPAPSKIGEIQLEENQHPALIQVNMKLERAKIENITVKKTVTLPSYMNIWGEKHHINFSGLLQEQIRSMMWEENGFEPLQTPISFKEPSISVSGKSEKSSVAPNGVAIKFLMPKGEKCNGYKFKRVALY